MAKLPLSSEPVARFNELLHSVSFAIVTTVEQNGNLRSRPMTSQQVDFDGELWFFGKRASALVDDIRFNPHVNIALVAPEKIRYLSASGTTEIIEDRWKIQELWNASYRAWFPEGLDDPTVVLLKVTVCHAEFWEPSKNSMVRLLGSSRGQ